MGVPQGARLEAERREISSIDQGGGKRREVADIHNGSF
jgi:hypothetical protein